AMTNADGLRIVCPRCRANNFAGKTHCWQCSATLPPPESASAPPLAQHGRSAGAGPNYRQSSHTRTPGSVGRGQAAAPAQNYGKPRPAGSRLNAGAAALVAAAALLTFLVVWLIGGQHSSESDATRAPGRPAPILT